MFNYTDHIGNIRLSWAWDDQNEGLKIIEESHYYPFGLKHRAYNTNQYSFVPPVNGVPGYAVPTLEQAGGRTPVNPFKYKYQGQERQEEIGLNWDSFKWRNYDYAIGRFMSIDPLAEQYAYNSTYAFQENKLGLGVELEGLELVINRGRENYMKDEYSAFKGVVNTIKGLFSDNPGERGAAANSIADNFPGVQAVQTYDRYRSGESISFQEAVAAAADYANFATIVTGAAAVKGGSVKGVTQSEASGITKNVSVSTQLQEAADSAVKTVGEGKGAVYGTKVHSEFAKNVSKIKGVTSEVSYKDGVRVKYGTKGSVRADAIYGNVDKPKAVYDLKTGDAKLTDKNIKKYNQHLPDKTQVLEIKPKK